MKTYIKPACEIEDADVLFFFLEHRRRCPICRIYMENPKYTNSNFLNREYTCTILTKMNILIWKRPVNGLCDNLSTSPA